MSTTLSFKRKTIEVNGKAMSFIDEGQGPVLLLGHSFLWSAEMWRPQITALMKNFRCIVPDLWSHGLSESLTESTYTIAQLADDYQSLMDKLEISEYSIIGLSVAGMWGTQLALNDPRVCALIIMDTYVGAEPEITKQTYYGLMDAILSAGRIEPAMANEVAPYFFAPDIEKTNPQLIQQLKTDFSNFPAAHIPGIVTLSRTIFGRKSLLNKLNEIQMPTLVVVGEGDIPRPPPEAEEMANLIPNAKLVTVKNAGHICNLEQPEVVTKCLSQFLESLPKCVL